MHTLQVLGAIRSVQVLDGRKRATIVVLGGGKQKVPVVKPSILKKSPSMKHLMKPAGGNMVGAGEDDAVRKKVHFDEAHTKETRPKKRKRSHEEGDDCERLLKLEGIESVEPAARPKKRKRKHEEDHLLSATSQQKKHKVEREDSEAATASVKRKKHVKKKKKVPGSRADVVGHDSLVSASTGERKCEQWTDLGPQSKKRAVDEDAIIPDSLSHEAEATSQYAKPGLTPSSRKGKKSNVKTQSGVVSVQKVKFRHRREKRGHGYSPTDILPGTKVEIGVGHESTWT